MVPAANRPELIARHLKHGPLFANGTSRNSIEDWMLIDALRVQPTEPEGDHFPNLVHYAAHINVSCDQTRPHRAVTARDVIADTVWRTMVPVTDDAAHGHRITEMVVRTEHAQRAGLGVETPGQLRACPIVGFAEHNRIPHNVIRDNQALF